MILCLQQHTLVLLTYSSKTKHTVIKPQPDVGTFYASHPGTDHAFLQLSGPSSLTDAQKLRCNRYLRRGLMQGDEIGQDGRPFAAA